MAAMRRRRRRCIGAVGVEIIGIHVEPHRRCFGGAARSPDPICFCSAQGPSLGRPRDLGVAF
eukprot:223373-Pyramimonas_sp.AAC.1